jgi:hypothetical protein
MALRHSLRWAIKSLMTMTGNKKASLNRAALSLAALLLLSCGCRAH